MNRALGWGGNVYNSSNTRATPTSNSEYGRTVMSSIPNNNTPIPTTVYAGQSFTPGTYGKLKLKWNNKQR